MDWVLMASSIAGFKVIYKNVFLQPPLLPVEFNSTKIHFQLPQEPSIRRDEFYESHLKRGEEKMGARVNSCGEERGPGTSPAGVH